MALDGTAARDALRALVQGLTGMPAGAVYDYVPTSFGTSIGAYVVVVTLRPADKTTGNHIGVTWTLEVGFGYRAGAAPSGAEGLLITLAERLVRAFYGDRQASQQGEPAVLFSVVDNGVWVPGPPLPDYRLWAGAETRLLPVFFELTQYETIPSAA